MNIKRACLLLSIIAVASVAVGSLSPQMQQHKAHSESIEAEAPARSAYYMIVFASQSESNEPRSSHTFATFVKARGKHESEEDFRIEEAHTISWMPSTLDVVILRLRPEAGANLDLQATLRWADSVGARVYAWGPYQIQEELYERALAQEARLNSGAVQYKAVDDRFRPGPASNCIHAVSDIAGDDGLLHVGRQWGQAASGVVVEHFRRWLIDPERSHPWVKRQLGLDDRPIITLTLNDYGRAPAR